jgi:hypothetical protein
MIEVPHQLWAVEATEWNGVAEWSGVIHSTCALVERASVPN